MTDDRNSWKTFTEEIEVAGHQLVEEINRLLMEGNVRKLQIRSEKGDVFLNVPLTAGALAGGVVALAAPWLAVLAAIAGLVAKVKIEIVRAEDPNAAAGRPSDAPGHDDAPTS